MAKFVLLLCSVAICLNAQITTCTSTFNQVTCSKAQTDYVSPIINAMKANADAQFKAQQLRLQQEQVQLQRDQLRLDEERQHNSRQEEHSPEQQQLPQAEVDKTLQSLRERHADFSLYEGRMAELMNSFLPGKTATLYGYVEGLYVIAKHERTEDEAPTKP